jgi:hypothetical protein
MPLPNPETPATPAPAEALPAGETENAYDAMSSVFDKLVEGNPPSTTAVDPKAGTQMADSLPAAESGEAAAPAGETPPASAARPASAPAGEPAGEPAATPPAEVDWKAKFDELQAKTKAAPATEAAPPPEAAPPDVAPAATPAAAPAPMFSAEEMEFLSSYDKEWADVIRGESLKRRAEYSQLVGHVFREISRVYGPLVEQGARAAETVAQTSTLVAIRSVHSDYDDSMYESVVEWANGLSGYRKTLANGIIENGEPQDVIDLISEYKSAKGLSKPRVVAGPAAPATPAVAPLSAPAKKAAQALGVVETKRTAATTNPADARDFDAAWSEATADAK